MLRSHRQPCLEALETRETPSGVAFPLARVASALVAAQSANVNQTWQLQGGGSVTVAAHRTSANTLAETVTYHSPLGFSLVETGSVVIQGNTLVENGTLTGPGGFKLGSESARITLNSNHTLSASLTVDLADGLSFSRSGTFGY